MKPSKFYRVSLRAYATLNGQQKRFFPCVLAASEKKIGILFIRAISVTIRCGILEIIALKFPWKLNWLFVESDDVYCRPRLYMSDQ